jgi:hypothetical protein
MHKVEDGAIITPTLLRRFELEATSPFYWALIQTKDRNLLSHGHGPTPDAMIQRFATDVLNALNRKLHHDGAWVIVFCDPSQAENDNTFAGKADLGAAYGRFVLLWMDADGDVQFPIMMDRPFHEYVAEGLHSLMECAEAGWKSWKHFMRDVLAPKPEQMIKRALGETVH